MFGKGLVVGLKITLEKFFKKKVTELYPEVKPKLPERSHGSFDYNLEKCISCNLCANACPNSVIKVESVKNESGKKVVEEYKMNLSYCLFCGLCVDACPTSALNFKSDFELACFKREGTIFSWSRDAVVNNITATESTAFQTVNK